MACGARSHASLVREDIEVDTRSTRFGMREISTAADEIHLNGESIRIRGVLEMARQLLAVKETGLNLVRVHI